jgi:tricorn protease
VPTLLPVLFASFVATAAEGPTLLLRQPTVGGGRVAFAYAGDLWVTDLEGAAPRRLTVHEGLERDPHLSPDGSLLAFTGDYDGNSDVYVVPTVGGQPERVTYHPGVDGVRGWSPDGRILFRSERMKGTRKGGRLFLVAPGGAWPEVLPLPMAEDASYGAEGAELAYTPIAPAIGSWKHYRGGQVSFIWRYDPTTAAVTEVPHPGSNDLEPLFVGQDLFFISDRAGVANLFVQRAGGAVEQVTRHDDLDVRSAGAGGDPGAEWIVYEQGGRLHRLDPRSGEAAPMDIQVQADLPAARAHWVDVSSRIESFAISPTGQRAVFGARGEIFTVPAEHGDVRNLTRSPGVNDRYPAWSPDGATVLSLSDASGEYALDLLDPQQGATGERVSLGDASFYYQPRFSPDGSHIAYTDKRMKLWVMDLDRREPVLVAEDRYDHPHLALESAWSPDGAWLAYTLHLPNHLRAVFMYELATGRHLQLSDGLADAISPAFSSDGRYLYFAASTDQGLNTAWLDMSRLHRPLHRHLWVAVLSADDPSPLVPRSDEEPLEAEEPEGKKNKKKGEKDDEEEPAVVVRIDADGLQRRVLALPVDPGKLDSLQAGAEGRLFFVSHPDHGDATLHRYDPEEREANELIEGLKRYVVSADGEKLLYEGGDGWAIVGTGDDPEPGDGALELSDMRAWSDPALEWPQIFAEAWRIQRDWFYDPGMHGVDWATMAARYEPWLAHVQHRSDLNYVLGELIGELVVGHAYRWGGDIPKADTVPVGLLGADLELVDGSVRIARIFDGEQWNPNLRSPLAAPGLDVATGDWLLAIDGVTLDDASNPYALLAHKAGRRVVLTVADDPQGGGSRDLTVRTVEREQDLRHRAWLEDNRRKVDAMSDGRLAYLYVPNTYIAGYDGFTRGFYSQLDKQGVVIDERYNGGGLVADYIVDMLRRQPLNWHVTREGLPYASPLGVIPGPRVMIVNQYAGSGGDCLPHYFRLLDLGTIVGTRTWGGLVGIYGYPALMDGGMVTAPRIAFYGADGSWTAENVGVAPDVEVEITPADFQAGRDPQLERAVEIALEALEARPVVQPQPPAFPDYGAQ